MIHIFHDWEISMAHDEVILTCRTCKKVKREPWYPVVGWCRPPVLPPTKIRNKKERIYKMDIDKLSVKQIERFQKLIELKDEAKELYYMVVNNQKVKLLPDYKDRFILWDDSNNQEYLKYENNNWAWVASYLHQHYEVTIDLDSIYQQLVRAYEWQNNPDKRGYTNNDEDAIRYFSAYARGLVNKK